MALRNQYFLSTSTPYFFQTHYSYTYPMSEDASLFNLCVSVRGFNAGYTRDSTWMIQSAKSSLFSCRLCIPYYHDVVRASHLHTGEMTVQTEEDGTPYGYCTYYHEYSRAQPMIFATNTCILEAPACLRRIVTFNQKLSETERVSTAVLRCRKMPSRPRSSNQHR